MRGGLNDNAYGSKQLNMEILNEIENLFGNNEPKAKRSGFSPDKTNTGQEIGFDPQFIELPNEKQLGEPDTPQMLKPKSKRVQYTSTKKIEIEMVKKNENEKEKKKPGLFKRLITPYRKVKEDQLIDSFFYPQRFLAAVFLTIVSIGFFIYLTFVAILTAAGG